MRSDLVYCYLLWSDLVYSGLMWTDLMWSDLVWILWGPGGLGLPGISLLIPTRNLIIIIPVEGRGHMSHLGRSVGVAVGVAVGVVTCKCMRRRVCVWWWRMDKCQSPQWQLPTSAHVQKHNFLSLVFQNTMLIFIYPSLNKAVFLFPRELKTRKSSKL